jgi:hypothetical protein
VHYHAIKTAGIKPLIGSLAVLIQRFKNKTKRRIFPAGFFWLQ